MTTSLDEFAKLKTKLNSILAESQLVEAGRIHMVGLDSLRVKLGDRWERLRDRILSYTEKRLEHHLSEKDAFFSYGEGEYIIVFANLSHDAARLVAAKIAEDVHQFIMGSRDSENIVVKSAVQKVDGELLFKDVQLAELLAKSREPAKQDDELGQVEEEDEDLSLPPISAVEFLFRPMWDVQKKTMSTYRIVPRRKMPASYYVEGYAAVHEETPERTVLDLDVATIKYAAKALIKSINLGQVFAINVPVHYETISRSETRRDYFSIVDSIPEQVRRFFIVELAHLPLGVPSVRVSEFSAFLRTRFRAVTCVVPFDLKTINSYAEANLFGLGIDLSLVNKQEAEILRRFDSFSSSTHSLNMKTYIMGINSVSLAVGATVSGINYISGPLVGEDRAVPSRNMSMTWDDFFTRAQGNSPQK